MTLHKPNQSTTGAAAPAANAFASAVNGAVAEAMEKGTSAFAKSMRTFQQEGAKFMARRIEGNMKAAEQFGACRTLPDFLAAQQNWFADTARAYNEEWVRCGELMTEVFEDDTASPGDRRSDRSSPSH